MVAQGKSVRLRKYAMLPRETRQDRTNGGGAPAPSSFDAGPAVNATLASTKTTGWCIASTDESCGVDGSVRMRVGQNVKKIAGPC